ncbi:NAD(P)-dependent dehydrogenase, short-chain alcohol dehydrogenase family [Halobiforma haloterrestris]|uniref:NAD(P)-dependent dehydrogenase, short-chain alcohol dehydrogenase family n=1 Tax=Natronobacterium haloterrestre TaxID=148448 RepID=A0A1I1JBU1_NATHA|nr:glucose 1-dehydrogenase [Halobiforma haloterrestris]SFC45845.1 NAD(P)-dependent dehydrogenase, short-chain alcohol dehydrogenase family [Halobiforma haloterrestris]
MSTSQFSVDGDVAVVTGASSGIGEAIAKSFADDGVDVVICSREQENVDPVAEEIAESDRPGEALAVECDVTDREAVDALVEATVEEFDGLDVLVNNAGASFMANFDDISENGWKTIVDINLHGTYNCIQAAADHLKDGGGSVVNFASVAGQQGAPYMSHYGAAKAAVVNLTTTLAYEWASEDVRVNCIAPGFVATEGVESQMGISADDVDRSAVERRMGTVEEIADLTQFLASPASSYIVGETITARGVPDVMESPDV